MYNVQMLISQLMFSVSFLAWPSTSAMENAKQNSTIFINTCLYLLISLPLFFVRIFHLQGRVGVGRVDGEVCEIEEQGRALVVTLRRF